MHTSKNIQLKQAPILHQFLQRLFAFDEIEMRFDIGEELLIESRCECTDKDCATVYLKRVKEWDKKMQGSRLINTTKGLIILHFYEDGYFEVEALCYKKYPYKQEIQRVLKGDFSSPRASELKLLEEYFSDLKEKKMGEVIIDKE